MAAVTDGAEWEQGFIDYHWSDTTRILDFPPACEHVAVAGRVVQGEATPAFAAWFAPLCHRLKPAAPEQTLEELRHLIKLAAVEALSPEVVATMQAQLDYREKRRAMMTYATFQQHGLPSGEDCVESANKLVVESRLKQAGLRWAPAHINPMVVLRNVAYNDRWAEVWTQIIDQQRTQARHRTAARRPLPLNQSRPPTRQQWCHLPRLSRRAP